MKKILLAVILVVVLHLIIHRHAKACEVPPCADEIAQPAPCPEGETCVEGGPVQNLQAADDPQSDAGVGSAAPVLQPVEVQPLPVIEVTPTAPAAPQEPVVTFRKHPRHYGLGLDLGFPDGAGLNATWRPAYWARASVGGTFNSIAPGLHGGVTVVPFARWRHGLDLTAEAGYASSGDVNKTYGTHEPALSDVSYHYANLHAGWEWGYERATFFIHGGESYIMTTVHNATQQVNGRVTFNNGPNVTLWVPTFKLGFIVYFGR